MCTLNYVCIENAVARSQKFDKFGQDTRLAVLFPCPSYARSHRNIYNALVVHRSTSCLQIHIDSLALM